MLKLWHTPCQLRVHRTYKNNIKGLELTSNSSSISAIFTFWTRVLAPEIYAAHCQQHCNQSRYQGNPVDAVALPPRYFPYVKNKERTLGRRLTTLFHVNKRFLNDHAVEKCHDDVHTRPGWICKSCKCSVLCARRNRAHFEQELVTLRRFCQHGRNGRQIFREGTGLKTEFFANLVPRACDPREGT
jgi:hypothetical protein